MHPVTTSSKEYFLVEWLMLIAVSKSAVKCLKNDLDFNASIKVIIIIAPEKMCTKTNYNFMDDEEEASDKWH
jgi:hypothetical protein